MAPPTMATDTFLNLFASRLHDPYHKIYEWTPQPTAEEIEQAAATFTVDGIWWEWPILKGSVKGFVDLRCVFERTAGDYSVYYYCNFEVQTGPYSLPELLRKLQYYRSFLSDVDSYFVVAPMNEKDSAIVQRHGFAWINLEDLKEMQ